jgi:hypothetical protein
LTPPRSYIKQYLLYHVPFVPQKASRRDTEDADAGRPIH